MEKRTIGIDLGGTGISFIDMYSPERVISTEKVATPATREEILSVLRDVAGKMLGSRPDDIPAGIGLAAAGEIDPLRKSIVFSPNLPFKEEFPLGAELERMLGIEVFMDNDANAAAMGEMTFGGAMGMGDFILLTLGTGIGSGIVTGGKILRGHTNTGGEAGHIVMDPEGPVCGCGNRGCLETYASGTAISRMAEETYGERKSGRDICEMAVQGDEKARDILRVAGGRLGDGLVSLVNIFNPEGVFFSGSLASAPPFYFEPAFDKVRKFAFGRGGKGVKLEISRLKERIGVIGAAALPLQG